MNKSKRYTVDVVYTTTVFVTAPDDESAVMEALEIAEGRVADGDGISVEPTIISIR